MEYTVLNNGLKMPLLGFGTYKIENENECVVSVLEAIEAGYRLIDTAQFYGNEEAVGKAIKISGIKRDELFITTKVWFSSYESGICRNSVFESMKKLGVDYIDMVLLHWPFGNVYAAWRDLERLYEEGKIKAIGVSNFDPDRLVDLIAFNKIVPAVNQIETHLYCQRIKESEWLKKYGVAHQAYTPLGRGKTAEMLSEPLVLKVAEKYRKTPAQIALKYLVQNRISAIPKSVHKKRINENFDIFDFELSSGDMNELKRIDTALPMIGNAENPQRVEALVKNI